jgi:hypothetical protein
MVFEIFGHRAGVFARLGNTHTNAAATATPMLRGCRRFPGTSPRLWREQPFVCIWSQTPIGLMNHMQLSRDEKRFV